MKRLNAARISLDKTINNFPRAVAGTIIDRNDGEPFFGVVNLQQRPQNVCDHRFLVVGCNQHCHRRPVCRINVNIRMPLLVDEPVDREAIMPHHVNADKQYDSTK